MPAASWFTPSAPFAVTGGSPAQYYQATLAWSYRHTSGQIDYPRVTNRMLLSDQGTFLDVQDGDDTAGRQFIIQGISWGWDPDYFDQLVTGFLKPGQTHNFVLVFDTSGGLSGGNTAQLWCNGVLVASSSHAWADLSLYSMTLLGTGATVLPGETQGFWFAGSSALVPATVFSTLFNGTEGMLDLNANPAIGGVSPTNYHIEPGESTAIEGTVSGSISLTGSAEGTVRSSGSVSGTIGLTGSAVGSVRSAGSVSGSLGLTGAASGSVRSAGTVSGTIGLSGSAAGSVRVSGLASGSIGLTGSALGAIRVMGAGSGSISLSGSASGAVRVGGTVEGTIGLTGSAEGGVTLGPVSGTIEGTIGLTGQAYGSVRVVGSISGSISLSGFASDAEDSSRRIILPGFWTEHAVEGSWPLLTVEGFWRQNIVEGIWE